MSFAYLLLTPYIAALLSLFPNKKNIRALEIIAGLAGVIEFVAGIVLVRSFLDTKNIQQFEYFALDALGVIVLAIIIVIGCAAAFYSIGYLREEVRKEIIGFHRVREYFVLFHIFIGAMLVSVSSTSPVIMWIALEATTISTLFLVSFYNKPSATEAAWKYLLINSIGLLLGYFGMLLFFAAPSLMQGHALITWESLFAVASTLNPLMTKVGFIFVLIGFGTKMGLAPMHTWLPDAHGKAPSPISALLSGTLLNVAFLAIMRFKTITDAVVEPSFSKHLLLTFGTISLIVSAFIIFTQKKYKRLFAYSSIEHMGLIAIGFGIGGIGSLAAVLHMVYHSITKSLLFFTAGNVFLKYRITKIQHIQGLFSALPITSVLLFIGFLSIAGVPPFGMFLTEFMILTSAFGQYPYLVVVILALLVLVFAGFFRHVTAMMFGTPSEEIHMGEMNAFTTIPVMCLAVLLIFLSIHVPQEIKELFLTAVVNR